MAECIKERPKTKKKIPKSVNTLKIQNEGEKLFDNGNYTKDKNEIPEIVNENQNAASQKENIELVSPSAIDNPPAEDNNSNSLLERVKRLRSLEEDPQVENENLNNSIANNEKSDEGFAEAFSPLQDKDEQIAFSQPVIVSAPELSFEEAKEEQKDFSETVIVSAPELSFEEVRESCPTNEDIESEEPAINFQECYKQLEALKQESQAVEKVNETPSYPSLRESSPSLFHPKIKSKISMKDINRIKPYTREQLLDLYPIPELERNSEYVDNFVKNEKEFPRHEFLSLLMEYQRAVAETLAMKDSIAKEEKDYNSHAHNQWKFKNQKLTQSGKCGDGRTVSKSIEYTVAVHDENEFNHLKTNLMKRKTITEAFTLASYSEKFTRLSTETYVFELIRPFEEMMRSNPPVSGYLEQEMSPSLLMHLRNMKTCISILFIFKRRIIREDKFRNDVDIWLTKLISVFLRTATLGDHKFLLNHILRCPSGFSKWAIKFIQPPPAPYWPYHLTDLTKFESPNLNNLIVMLATILLPAKARDEFLQDIKSSVLVNAANSGDVDNVIWNVIDSNGLEREDVINPYFKLTEKDVVGLIGQMDYASIFRHVLLISFQDNDVYDATRMSDNGMLKLLSFSTHFVELFHQCLQVYDYQSHPSLAKVLSNLIKHTMLYVLDHWENFKTLNTLGRDTSLKLRLQLEVDHFIFYSISLMVSSHNPSSWQYLASIPYGVISIPMLWRVLYLFHNPGLKHEESLSYDEANYEEILHEPESKSDFFKTILPTLSENEVSYLIDAFSSIGTAQSEVESVITFVTAEIFEIAFLHEKFKETLSKSGSIALSKISIKNPFITSFILAKIWEHEKSLGSLSLYIFQQIPLNYWKPLAQDLDIIEDWLLNTPLSSTTNQVARYILSYLNWDFEDNVLALDKTFHQKVALLIVQAYQEFINTSDSKTLVSWGLQQLLNVTAAVRNTLFYASSESGFISWAWDLMFRLRLHVLTNPFPPWDQVLNDRVIDVSNLDEDTWLQPLRQALDKDQPAAHFLALIMTQHGHSVENISYFGFNHLHKIMLKGQYPAVIKALYYTVPFFYSHPSILLKKEKFLVIIKDLIKADCTYFNIAKGLYQTEFPGKVLHQLMAMIQGQIGESISKSDAIKLWLQVFSHLYWELRQSRFANEINYLMDGLLKTLYKYDLLDYAKKVLKDIVKIPDSNSFSTGILSRVFSKGNSSENGVLLIPPTIQGGVLLPWFTFFALDIECSHEFYNNWWEDLLEKLLQVHSAWLVDSKKSASYLDQVLKIQATSIKVQLKYEHLPIIRWAQHCLIIPEDNLLLPWFWHKFFSYYFYRPVVGSQGVGELFFEDANGAALKNKLKARLTDISNYYYEYIQRTTTELDTLKRERTHLNENNNQAEDRIEFLTQKIAIFDEKIDFFKSLSKYYRLLELWLSENNLFTTSLDDIPERFNRQKLSELFSGKKELWLDLIDNEELDKQINLLHVHWKNDKPPLVNCEDMNYLNHKTATERILNRLNSYPEKQPPPPLPDFIPPCPDVDENIFYDKNYFLKVISKELGPLYGLADSYHSKSSEIITLNNKFLSLVPAKYRNVPKRAHYDLHCSKGNPSNENGCAGYVRLEFHYHVYEKDNSVSQNILLNRGKFTTLLSDLHTPLPIEVCSFSLHLNKIVSHMINKYHQLLASKLTRKAEDLRKIGVHLFHYYMQNLNNEVFLYYPATKHFFSSNLSTLGQEFVEGQEDACDNLLSSIAEMPKVGSHLSPLFQPSLLSTPTYIRLYKLLIDKLEVYVSTETALVLLSKFELKQWLEKARPSDYQVNELLQLTARIIFTFGKRNDALMNTIYVYRKYLQYIAMYNFPNHYFQVVTVLFTGMDNSSLNPEIWDDFFNSIKFPVSMLKKEDMCILFDKYASSQTLMDFNIINSNMDYIASLLMTKRRELSQRITLYNKYQPYMDKINILLGILSHVWIICSLSHETAHPTLVFQKLKHLFSACLEPLQEKDPWLPSEVNSGQKSLHLFIKCIQYFINCLKEEHRSLILSDLWQYYFSKFHFSSIHVESVFHQEVARLDWSYFVPTEEDFKVFSKVLNAEPKRKLQYDAFVTEIFVKMPWQIIPDACVMNQSTLESIATLLVELAWQPKLKQSGRYIQILNTFHHCQWSLLEPHTVSQLLQIFTTRANSGCMVKLSEDDLPLLNFLKILSAITPNSMLIHESGGAVKRHCYVQGIGSFYIIAAATHGTNMMKKDFRDGIKGFLNEIEEALNMNITKDLYAAQANDLSKVILDLTNLCAVPEIRDEMILSIILWLKSKPKSIFLYCFFRNCQDYLTVNKNCAVMMEECIALHFIETIPGTILEIWKLIFEAAELSHKAMKEEFLECCLTEGHYLTLVYYILGKLKKCTNITEEFTILNKIQDYLDKATPTQENEPKLLILWDFIIELCLRQLGYNKDVLRVYNSLQSLVDRLNFLGRDKDPSGFLGTIGMGKRSHLSVRFRFLAKLTSTFLQLQMFKSTRHIRLVPEEAGTKVILLDTQQEALKNFTLLQNNKEYAEVKCNIEDCCKYIMSFNYTLRNARQLLKSQTDILCPDIPYLQNLNVLIVNS